MTATTDDAILSASEFNPADLSPAPAVLPPIGTEEPTTPDHTAAADDEPRREGTPRERARRARESAPKPEKSAVPVVSDAKLRKALTQIYVTVGLGVMPFDATCANVVVMNAEKCAESLVTAAQTNPKIRRALIALTETGAWGGVMIAHLPILAAVAWHHSPSEAVRDTIAPLAAAIAGIDTTAMMAGDDQ